MIKSENLMNIYHSVRGLRNTAIMDEKDSLSAIYKGLKFVLEDGVVKILSTERDIYEEVPPEVYLAFDKGLDYGVNYFRVLRFSEVLKNQDEGTNLYIHAKKRLDESIRAINRG
jgi:hypothetical protein